MRKLIVVGAVALLTLLLAAPALAWQPGSDANGFSIHIERDATVDGAPIGTVVMIGADLTVSTSADTVVVIDGAVDLDAGTIGTVIAVNSTVRVAGGVAVTDLWLTSSVVDRAEGATIGTIRESGDPGFAGRWLSRLMVALAFALLTVVVGLAAAATVGRGFLRAAATVTEDPGPTALAAITTWLGLPILLVLGAVTLVGLPLAILVLVCVLPVVAAVGYAVVGLRIGQGVLRRGEIEGRPLMPTFVGIATLVVLGQIPGIGIIITLLATFVGSGAVTLTAWRTARGPRREAPATAPMLPS